MNYNIIQGDALQTLRTLPSCSVQMACTSPPYFGLRDYLTARWEGGDPECDHEPDKTSPSSTLQGGKATQGSAKEFRATCGKCGARRVDNQIGLEESPELYVAKLVEVFREVRRVLHPTGTCWINIGDSFWGGKGQSGYELPHEAEARRGRGETMQHAHNVPGYTNMRPTDGKHPVIKPKDLIGIPWMLAFALRADGWYLRSEIIWHKKAPMPESVTDRPTKAHEQLFLLAKSPTYYYDAEAIREPNVGTFNDFPSHARIGNGTGRPRYDPNGQAAAPSGHVGVNEAGRNKRSVFNVPAQYARMRQDLPDEVKQRVVAELIARGLL